MIHCGFRANHNIDQLKAKLSQLFTVPRVVELGSFLCPCVYRAMYIRLIVITLDTCLKIRTCTFVVIYTYIYIYRVASSISVYNTCMLASAVAVLAGGIY